MEMKWTLGEMLRAIILATPVVAFSGCEPNCGSRSPAAQLFSLTEIPDGGPSFADDAGCLSVCEYLVPGLTESCTYETFRGQPEVSCVVTPSCSGRRPQGLCGVRAKSVGGVGSYLAESARLEAASVKAFRVLCSDLVRHGASPHLVAATRQAARDEIRHTRVMAQLARHYGASAMAPSFSDVPKDRSLEAIALENAVEGCVRETFGAAVGLWQSHHAQDAAIAAAMASIAQDEVRHAELSWEVASWVEPRLSNAARERIVEAKKSEFATLASSVKNVPFELVTQVGLPTSGTAGLILESLVQATCS